MTKPKSAQKRAKLPNHGFLSSNQRIAYFSRPKNSPLSSFEGSKKQRVDKTTQSAM